jgi:hypothetical protein
MTLISLCPIARGWRGNRFEVPQSDRHLASRPTSHRKPQTALAQNPLFRMELAGILRVSRNQTVR